MKILDIAQEKLGSRARLSAQVIWEDSARPSQEIYFEVEEPFCNALASSPEAFVAAALTPALWAGEKRIFVDAEVCPEFLDNLKVVTKVFQHWFPQLVKNGEIETRKRVQVNAGELSRRAAFFFTGGVDSLAALRVNRLNFPRDHPGSIKDGIIVFGLEVEDRRAFDYVVAALSAIASDAAVALIPVFTNVRLLNDDWVFWWTAHMGPALCAVAHALSPRIRSAIIASDYDVPNLRPHGSHPLIEPNFSSFDLKIRYDGLALSRLEKIRLLADWDVALNNIRVCNKPEFYQSGMLNCGECEKCVRTMLGLLAVGALEKTRAFAHQDLPLDLVESKICVYEAVLPFYEEMVGALRDKGRADLADVIRKAIVRARAKEGLMERLRKFDRKHLGGGLGAVKRATFPSVPAIENRKK